MTRPTLLLAAAALCTVCQPASGFILREPGMPAEQYPHIVALYGPTPHNTNVTADLLLTNPIDLCSLDGYNPNPLPPSSFLLKDESVDYTEGGRQDGFAWDESTAEDDSSEYSEGYAPLYPGTSTIDKDVAAIIHGASRATATNLHQLKLSSDRHPCNLTVCFDADRPLTRDLTPAQRQGKVFIAQRGGCEFELKSRNAQALGASALVIGDYDDLFQKHFLGVGDEQIADGEAAKINISTVMLQKSTYEHVVNLLDRQPQNVSKGRHNDGSTAISATVDEVGIVEYPTEAGEADTIIADFAMLWPAMYCAYSFFAWLSVLKIHRQDARQRAELAAAQQQAQQERVAAVMQRTNGPASTSSSTIAATNGQTNIQHVNVIPAASSSASLASLPLGTGDISDETSTPRTALLAAHNETTRQLDAQQQRYNRIVKILQTIQRITSPSMLFATAVIVYTSWIIAGATLLYVGRDERDCDISVKWLLMLRISSAWLAIRHAYYQTHSEIDNQPYLDKAQHLVWFSMIVFNSAWLLTDQQSATTCHKAAPTAYMTVIAMAYITIGWMLVATALHMFVNSQYAGNGVVAVCFKAVLKYLQLGWVLAGPLDTPTALNSLELEYLPTIKFEPGMFRRPDDAPDEEVLCSICMCEYNQGESIMQLGCGHHYHAECVNQWLRIHAKCPLCVRPVLVTDLAGQRDGQIRNQRDAADLAAIDAMENRV